MVIYKDQENKKHDLRGKESEMMKDNNGTIIDKPEACENCRYRGGAKFNFKECNVHCQHWQERFDYEAARRVLYMLNYVECIKNSVEG